MADMLIKLIAFAGLFATIPSFAETLTQQQACAQFSDAVVQIDAGGQSHGTGFLVSSSGQILTASHVVRDDSGYYHAIEITTTKGEHLEAIPSTDLTFDSAGKDYALLKVTTSHPLPFLSLGSTKEVNIGGDGTIIGYPFSALGADGTNIKTEFCLSATFAAVSHETHPIPGTQRTKTGIVRIKQDVQVDVIYFQGPSIKGLSGSPVISRTTGNVVGILSTKLTGIGADLDILRKQIAISKQNVSMSIGGIDPLDGIDKTIVVLDQQLANGLGSAVGVEAAEEELHHPKRKK